MRREATGHYVATSTAGESVLAFVPAPLPPDPPVELAGSLQALHEQALLACGRLDGVSSLLPDPDLFLYSYVRREALLSSQIEGTQSSLSDLLLFELEEAPGVPFDDVVEVSTSLAPRRFREPGQRNDESNEINLDPLPFTEGTAPTLIAQGENDALPLMDHATSAASKMPGAELMLVEEGHHGLPWCRHIGAVARRQLELSLA